MHIKRSTVNYLFLRTLHKNKYTMKKIFSKYLKLATPIYDFAVCMELIHPYETINEQPIIP